MTHAWGNVGNGLIQQNTGQPMPAEAWVPAHDFVFLQEVVVVSSPTSMEHHPDIVEMRARYEQTASTPRAQAVQTLALLTGLYLAISPWVAGFSGLTALAISNLVTGLAYALLLGGLGSPYERTHGMAWAATLIGVWTIVSPWVVYGPVDTTRTIINNVVVGAVALLLGLAYSMLTKAGRSREFGRRTSSQRGARV
jgi:hypothetical protein